jgi:hypothetical protein
MAGLSLQETVAEQPLTIACSAVGAHWARDFPICIDRGLWGSKGSTADKMSHRSAFERIQPGQLGIAVHGFRWQNPADPPRNATGSRYGPRAPFKHFVHAQFSELALFEVEAPAYSSRTRVWSETEPDEWDLRIPLNIYAHEKDVQLRMDKINPAVAEAIRMSGIFASMPWVIAPATLESPRPESAPRTLTTGGSTDVLGHVIQRREASAMRRALLAGRAMAPCAFCERDCVTADLEVAHLKTRRLCEEHERLDTGVAVMACVTCHHCFDAGAIFVDGAGVIRTNEAAGKSEWRREMLRHLDGRAFSCFGPPNQPYLGWHRREVAKVADAPLHLSLA